MGLATGAARASFTGDSLLGFLPRTRPLVAAFDAGFAGAFLDAGLAAAAFEAGFALDGLCAASAVSVLSDFELARDRFAGGESDLSGDAARFVAVPLALASVCGFFDAGLAAGTAFEAGFDAGFADAARELRLGGMLENMKS